MAEPISEFMHGENNFTVNRLMNRIRTSFLFSRRNSAQYVYFAEMSCSKKNMIP